MPEHPQTIVIFGASGDLTARKLIPSLYRLDGKKRLPEGVRVAGVARSPFSHDEFRAKMAKAVQEHAAHEWSPEQWDRFARRLFYAPGDASTPEGLTNLEALLAEHEGATGGDRLYYLAVAPDLYGPIATRLGERGMSQDVAAGDGKPASWRRLIIEKPFGHDVASARALNQTLQQSFREHQVY